MKMAPMAALAAITTLAAPASAQPDPKALAYKLPDQIAWQGDPVKGPLTYALWGDPAKPGPYAILVKWPPHQMSRPHTHPNDRHVYVISGTWWVGTGQTFSPDTTMPIPAGSVVTHFARQWHYDGAKDEAAVLEITGEGPQ
ncbi:cupin domain-containing protein [Phenylobacterium sp.]|uniref:cupin domain-containing protein n=1 Tax=Phenylobacterium sp. TaxID=1871053 RepID=UPI0025D3CE92|nr:cupin domain-containing protein [Phenylobacterium sp.]